MVFSKSVIFKNIFNDSGSDQGYFYNCNFYNIQIDITSELILL